ncbi:hypothetical protein DdX_15924 [Ditylenchus destructor]|uniref:Transmembrane protein n=1 Tax=Ditylenchus destructor TaxID=166010 RepID=A0AAD4MRD4_9BILA|nr:hypothetical protein DdX_15924 [Ditylenchus destructor]
MSNPPVGFQGEYSSDKAFWKRTIAYPKYGTNDVIMANITLLCITLSIVYVTAAVADQLDEEMGAYSQEYMNDLPTHRVARNPAAQKATQAATDALVVPAIRRLAASLSRSVSQSTERIAPGPKEAITNMTKRVGEVGPVQKSLKFMEAEGKEISKSSTGAILGAGFAAYGAITAAGKVTGLKKSK